MINRRIVLASRPAAKARWTISASKPSSCRRSTTARCWCETLAEPGPYMRMRMNEGKSYAAAQAIGVAMVGGTAGEVVESRHERFQPGDKVVGGGGWQEYSVVDATQPEFCARSTHRSFRSRPTWARWHAWRHGLGGLTQIIQPSPARRWSSVRPAAPSAAPWASWRRCAAAAPWASQAVRQVRLCGGDARLRCLHRLQGAP